MAVMKNPPPYIRPTAMLANVNIQTSDREPSPAANAGFRARSISSSQTTRPVKRPICHTRPRSTYS